MKPDPENNKTLMDELELKLREGKERYELLKSDSELAKYVACQEVEQYKRGLFSLTEKMIRLEEDYKISRERELKDEEKIRGLLDEIERKEAEFKDKFVELNMERRDLECGKRRAMDEASEWKKKYMEFEDKVSMLLDEIMRKDVDIRDLAFAKKRVEDEANEWKNKYKELEARELKLVEEITQLKEQEKEELWRSTRRNLFKRPVINIDEELPERTSGSVQKSPSVDLLLTPEQRSKRIVVDVSDSEDNCGDVDIVDVDDRITFSQIKRRKLTDLFDAANEASGSQASGLCKVANSEAKGTCVEVGKVADVQNLSLSGNKALQVTDSGLQSYCKRQYTGRVPSSEERYHAKQKAEKLKCNLKSCHPSFIRSMVKSHVSGGFWFGLPNQFCKDYLTTEKLKMVLEDERGSEYNVIYIGDKTALSGGWRGFALAHSLEFGDALLFELCEPTRFKVYIFKANLESREEHLNDKVPADDTSGTPVGALQIQSKEQDIDLMMPLSLAS